VRDDGEEYNLAQTITGWMERKYMRNIFLLQSEWYFFVVRRLARGRVKLVNKSVTLAKFNTKKKICSTVVCVGGGGDGWSLG